MNARTSRLIALALALACSKPEPAPTTPPAAAGCGSDKDCKGDRVCEQGQCVDPHPSAPPTPPSAPSAPEAPPPSKAETPPVPPLQPKPAEPMAVSRAEQLAAAPGLGATRPYVLVAMFADLECPFSARATTVVRALVEKHGRPDGVVRFEYRHDPLDAHARATALAQSAVAAQLQGRFWQFHDRVLADQQKLDDATVFEHAAKIGADMTAFQADRVATDVQERVAHDRAIALALGVTGTPTFFVNGRKLTGIQTLADLEAVVLDEVEKGKATQKPPMEALLARIRENNPDYGKYLLDGQAPPPAARPPMPVDKTVWKVPVAAEDASVGPADAPVTIVEFADFECPFSARLAPVLKQLVEKRQGAVRLVYKHNPLAIHAGARAAAQVAVYAQSQGKFWELHDALYARTGPLAEGTVVEAAATLGLSREAALAWLAKGDGTARIEADQALAARIDAVGTPNLYINGRRVVGARTLEELDALVEEVLAEAKALEASGVAKDQLYAKTIEKGVQKPALAEEKLEFALDGAPVLGEATAPATLVLFSDFQCPFSSRLIPILDRAMAKFPGQVRLAFKHFPQDFHPQAIPAARMAICADEQQKFWPLLRQFLDVEKQKDLSDAARAGYAKAAGLDPKALEACLASKRPEAVLARDAGEATMAEVKGTPTLFINGRRFTSPTGYNDRSLGGVLSLVLGRTGE